MERRGFNDHYADIAAGDPNRAQTPDKDLPRRPRGSRRVVSPMLSQFLSTSIACISRQHKLAPPIVGNADDVRELLGYELDRRDEDAGPRCSRVGGARSSERRFAALLAGELAIRVADVKEAATPRVHRTVAIGKPVQTRTAAAHKKIPTEATATVPRLGF